MNYTITVTLTTDAHTDEHLQDELRITDELHSWLESLGATVRDITVRAEEEEEEEEETS
jgi:hypothetical protein